MAENIFTEKKLSYIYSGLNIFSEVPPMLIVLVYTLL